MSYWRGVLAAVCHQIRCQCRFNLRSDRYRSKRVNGTELFVRPFLFSLPPVALLSFVLPGFGITSVPAKLNTSLPSRTKTMEVDKSKKLNDLLQHADQLFDENRSREANDLLQGCETPDVVEVLWRRAKALHGMSKSADSKQKEAHIREGFALVASALTKDDRSYAVHKWMAILLDAKSELDGLKARASQIENIKHHMLKAVEYNPNDPTSWYMLGSLYYGVADLPWYQRKIVETFFATPPTHTFDEAVEQFERAEQLKANFYSMNHLMLGKCYLKLKDTDKAKHFLTLAANCVVIQDDDKKCKEEAQQLLKKL